METMDAQTTPLVSVVLPTRNGERYLAQAVESVLAQTHRNLELIIVDDASTDTTPEVIAAFADSDARIVALRNEQNQRLPAALNTGFRATRGSYLTWTSDDNMYRPEAIARMLAELEGHPEAGLVYADCTVIDENGNILKSVSVLPPEKLAHLNSVGACFLYPRRVYEAVGEYDSGFLLAEDYEYWLRIAGRFTMRPLHEDLYLRRSHAGSLTAQYGKLVLDAHEQVLARHLPDMGWAGRTERAAGYRVLVECAIRRRHYRLAWRRMLSAARLAPLRTLEWALSRVCSTISQLARGSRVGV